MSVQAQTGLNEVPTCHGGYENLDTEYDYWIGDVEGEIPADLRGTFLRNGPGRQKIGGETYGHWFDGDGMLSAFTFSDAGVRFRNRYVRTTKYLAETAAQKVLYRGFGTQIPGGWTKNMFKFPANPSNTSVIYHAGRLLTLNEGGKPWQLEAGSLKTIGEFDYNGELTGRAFSAHGKVHPSTGDYINFGSGSSPWRLGKLPQPCLDLYRINKTGHVARTNRILLDTFPFCHDFAMSDRFGIFFINSIVIDGMGGFFLGLHSLSDRIHFDHDQPMKIVVVDLDSLETVAQFETDPGAIIHFGNAFEEGEELQVDGMFTADFEGNDVLSDILNPHGRIGGGEYRRFRLNLRTGSVSSDRVCEYESEFPTFDTRLAGSRHSLTYTACSVDNGADSFYNAIARIDFEGQAELLTLEPGCYGSEPLFVPAAGSICEADGYLLEVVYNACTHLSELRVFRADDLSGPVAVARLGHHLPHQFHGHFSAAPLMS